MVSDTNTNGCKIQINTFLMIIGLLYVWFITQMFILSLATSCWQMWQILLLLKKRLLLRHTAYSLSVYIPLDIENPAFDTTSITVDY